MSDGGSITIFGLGFGSKSPVAPVSFLDFESGATVGQPIPNPYNSWVPSSDGGSSHWPLVVSSYSGRTSKMIRCNPTAASGDMKSNIYLDHGGNRYWYLTYDSYKDWPADQSGRSKVFRIWSLAAGPPEMIYGMDPALIVMLNTTGAGSVTDYDAPMVRQQWSRDEAFLDSGTAGSANATYKFWEHTPGTSIQTFNRTTGFAMLLDSDHPVYGVAIGREFCDLIENISHYIDNVYVDNTQARVEIGDNAVWANCIRREIQIPHTTWNDTTIQATVRQGTFPAGSAFIFVVNESGVASAGVAVTFGQAATRSMGAKPGFLP